MEINKFDNPEFLNNYIMYMRVVKARSKLTITEYYMDIRLFLRYIKKEKLNVLANNDINEISIADFSIDLLKTITLNDIYNFEFYIADERNNHEKSRARKTAALKSLFKYLTKQVHILDKNPITDIEMPSQKKALPKYLTLEQSLDLLAAPDNSDNAKRDYCILTLFLNCGMRLSELVGINITDINFNERKIRVLGKGNKERMIYLNDACINSINDYLHERSASNCEALFISRLNKRISRRRVQQIVETALEKADLSGQGLSTHKLRHTAATLMYQYGNVDTLVLKEILGHESIATTEIYTHISNKEMQNAAESSPLANVKKTKSDDEQND